MGWDGVGRKRKEWKGQKIKSLFDTRRQQQQQERQDNAIATLHTSYQSIAIDYHLRTGDDVLLPTITTTTTIQRP
ncbi:hypothetical protein M0804_010810 [Polistes exclamans]|nr:hypothetical protein M0804_010810 [Polistes exclamans]